MIIKENSTEKLSEQVESRIKEGWIVQGGVAVGFANTFAFFAQAMTKKEE